MLGQYLRTLVTGAGSRLVAVVAQFGVIWLLNQVMPQGDFGLLMLVFAGYRMVALAIGTGLGSLVLYHVGKSGGDLELDSRLHVTAILYGSVISLAAAIGAVALSGSIADVIDKPELAFWLIHLSPLLVFQTLNSISIGSFDGRSKISRAIVIGELIPNVMQLALLALIAVLRMPDLAVAHAMWISYCLPWLAFAAPQLLGFRGKLVRLPRWDVRYAGFSSLNMLASQQLQGVDMLIVGVLFDAEQIARYALASRLALLFTFFQVIILRKFAPRAAQLIAMGDINKLNQELLVLKRWSLISVSGLTGLIVAASPFVMPLFGEYQQVVYLLIAFSIVIMFRCFYAGIDVTLKMSGRAAFGTAISICSAVVMVAVSWAASPVIGIYALPFSVLVSIIFLNTYTCFILFRASVVILNIADLFIVSISGFIIFGIFFINNHVTSGLLAGGYLLFVSVSLAANFRFKAELK